LKNLNLCPSYLKDNSKLIVDKRYSKYENYSAESDLIILKDGLKYFILFSKEKTFNKLEQKQEIISLDPGIRKFQSFYTPDGYVGSIGDKSLKNKVLNIDKRVDKLKSISKKRENIKNKSKKEKNRIWKINKKCYNLKNKVKNIIKDFQWKISSFLTKNYKVVLLPVFKSKDMQKNLNEENNRVLNIYSHYKFQQKILYQGTKYGCDVRIIDEYYTTKTCGNCGNINNFVGNSDVFWCPFCKIEMHRDYQAARNIYLKNT
jgi:putative transposase